MMSPPLPLAAGAPAQVLRTRLAATPQVLWARLVRGPFVAQYLGAALPDAALEPGCRIEGLDPQGRPLALTVTESTPPCSLSIRLQGAEGDRMLRWTVEALAQGSRLTVLHEAAAPAEARTDEPPDTLAALLAAPLPAALQVGRIGDAAALDLARRYLADSAQAVRLLLAAMAPGQGYRKPAPDRFSLVEQLWHLADVETFGWAQRLPRLLVEPRPVLPGVDGDRLALERRYQQRPWRGAARRFVAQRRRSLAALVRVDVDLLARPVVFSGQATDVGSLLAAMLAHDHEHRGEMALLWAQASAAPDQEGSFNP